MNKVKVALLSAASLVAMLSIPANAASFVKYVFAGQVSGTRTIQPTDAMGWSEAVAGTASFEYVIPLSIVGEAAGNATFTANSGYFLGARGEWSANGNVIGFFERGYGNAGVANYISASACLPSSAANLIANSGLVDGSCGAAVIRDTERGLSLNLEGGISSFTTQIMEGGPHTVGLNSYSVTIAAVPEPTIWATLLVGFGMMGMAMRYRRRTTKTLFA